MLKTYFFHLMKRTGFLLSNHSQYFKKLLFYVLKIKDEIDATEDLSLEPNIQADEKYALTLPIDLEVVNDEVSYLFINFKAVLKLTF